MPELPAQAKTLMPTTRNDARIHPAKLSVETNIMQGPKTLMLISRE